MSTPERVHDHNNEACPLNDPETHANPATRGMPCTCPIKTPAPAAPLDVTTSNGQFRAQSPDDGGDLISLIHIEPSGGFRRLIPCDSGRLSEGAVSSLVYSFARDLATARAELASAHEVIRADTDHIVALNEAVKVRDLAAASGRPVPEVAIPMLLTCPSCGERHIDEGEFATKPHHTHACQTCGMTWRPALVPTVGVRFLPGYKDEKPAPADTQPGHDHVPAGDRILCLLGILRDTMPAEAVEAFQTLAKELSTSISPVAEQGVELPGSTEFAEFMKMANRCAKMIDEIKTLRAAVMAVGAEYGWRVGLQKSEQGVCQAKWDALYRLIPGRGKGT